MSIQILCPYFIWIVDFLLLSCMSSLYVLDINFLSDIRFENIFSHSVGCVFILSMVSFAVQKLLSLIRSHLFIFAFVSFALGNRSKKYCYDLCQRVFCLCFLLGVFWFPVSQPVLNDYWPKSTHQVEDNIVTDFMHV